MSLLFEDFGIENSREENLYRKLNEEPIEIEYLPDEDEQRDLQPSFELDGARYYLDDFMRCHNNPWTSDIFPDFIHAYHIDYNYPLYLEIVDDDHVNVYVKD